MESVRRYFEQQVDDFQPAQHIDRCNVSVSLSQCPLHNHNKTSDSSIGTQQRQRQQQSSSSSRLVRSAVAAYFSQFNDDSDSSMEQPPLSASQEGPFSKAPASDKSESVCSNKEQKEQEQSEAQQYAMQENSWHSHNLHVAKKCRTLQREEPMAITAEEEDMITFRECRPCLSSALTRPNVEIVLDAAFRSSSGDDIFGELFRYYGISEMSAKSVVVDPQDGSVVDARLDEKNTMDETVRDEDEVDSDHETVDAKEDIVTALSAFRTTHEVIMSHELEPVDGILNKFVARHLLEHQLEGVKWMWGKYSAGKGAILGDEMGLGKTIQCAALLSAIYHKSGTMKDIEWMRIKKKGIKDCGRVSSSRLAQRINSYLRLAPSLVICPKAVLKNWEKELQEWGFFSIKVLSGSGNEEENGEVVRAVTESVTDIVLLPYSQLARCSEMLGALRWEVIILDEGHIVKNEKSLLYQNVRCINQARSRFLLTGTPIQNDLRELWAILYLVFNGNFLDKPTFIRGVEKPLKLGLSATASDEAVHVATMCASFLERLLENCLLRRDKRLLDDTIFALKGKEERIVFCDLSPLQADLYEYILQLPDFENARNHLQPCPCGSGRSRGTCCAIYRYPIKRTRAQQSDDCNNVNDDQIVLSEIVPASEGDVIPEVDSLDHIANELHDEIDADDTQYAGVKESDSFHNNLSKRQRATKEHGVNGKTHTTTISDIDERAVIWLQLHPDCQPCGAVSRKGSKGCPKCIILPALHILSKVASHPALLQHDPFRGGGGQRSERNLKQFVNQALNNDLRQRLGGDTRSRNLMLSKRLEHSGKLLTLHRMLTRFLEDRQKTLIFSLSTRVLDIIEDVVKSEGWTCSRLDGQTSAQQRLQLVEDFNHSSRNFIFLISSRAGGLGLNLTSARNVVIFDVDWNPTVDMQSQDRAYRIGQVEKVVVYRLVAKGTVEEMVYMRQLYKQQLQRTVLNNDMQPSAQNDEHNSSSSTCRQRLHAMGRRLKRGQFEGVEGEVALQGELFGAQNLFKYSRSSILHSLRQKYAASSSCTATVNDQYMGSNDAIATVSTLAQNLRRDEAKGKAVHASRSRQALVMTVKPSDGKRKRKASCAKHDLVESSGKERCYSKEDDSTATRARNPASNKAARQHYEVQSKSAPTSSQAATFTLYRPKYN